MNVGISRIPFQLIPKNKRPANWKNALSIECTLYNPLHFLQKHGNTKPGFYCFQAYRVSNIYIYITTDKTPHGGRGRWPDKDRCIYVHRLTLCTAKNTSKTTWNDRFCSKCDIFKWRISFSQFVQQTFRFKNKLSYDILFYQCTPW